MRDFVSKLLAAKLEQIEVGVLGPEQPGEIGCMHGRQNDHACTPDSLDVDTPYRPRLRTAAKS